MKLIEPLNNAILRRRTVTLEAIRRSTFYFSVLISSESDHNSTV